MDSYYQEKDNSGFNPNEIATNNSVTGNAAYNLETDEEYMKRIINNLTCSEKVKLFCAKGWNLICPCCARLKKQNVFEFNRLVVLRFGRFPKTYGPGYVELLDGIDNLKQIVDIREKCQIIQLPSVTTLDQIELKVTGFALYRINDPMSGVLEVAASETADSILKTIATKLLREVIEENTLDQITVKKSELQKKMAENGHDLMKKYGTQVLRILIKDIMIISTEFFEPSALSQGSTFVA